MYGVFDHRMVRTAIRLTHRLVEANDGSDVVGMLLKF